MTNSPRHESLTAARCCERCGQILPKANTVARREALASMVSVLGVLAIVAPAMYFASNWAADHLHNFLAEPPWHEPLDSWSLQ